MRTVVCGALQSMLCSAVKSRDGRYKLKNVSQYFLIFCDNINDDNLRNPVCLERSIIFPIFTPK